MLQAFRDAQMGNGKDSIKTLFLHVQIAGMMCDIDSSMVNFLKTIPSDVSNFKVFINTTNQLLKVHHTMSKDLRDFFAIKINDQNSTIRFLINKNSAFNSYNSFFVNSLTIVQSMGVIEYYELNKYDEYRSDYSKRLQEGLLTFFFYVIAMFPFWKKASLFWKSEQLNRPG